MKLELGSLYKVIVDRVYCFDDAANIRGNFEQHWLRKNDLLILTSTNEFCTKFYDIKHGKVVCMSSELCYNQFYKLA